MTGKTRLMQGLAACFAALTLNACAALGLGSSLPYLTQIHQGQTYDEVSTIMKSKPSYRRFMENGIEQWEYHKNEALSGDYDVILVDFRDGRVVSMDSFRYIYPMKPEADNKK